MKSKQAEVHFNDKGTPIASHFDDVYFSNDSGVDETLHVFVAGNDLLTRWENWQAPYFVIAETGFGTGLNFLVAMKVFSEFRQNNPSHPLKHLYFLSTEKYPLPLPDMQKALDAFPTLQAQANALKIAYPLGLEGCHRRHFEAFSTTLDLWIGDVHERLPQWSSPISGLVDAWFLDGFAPSKNPEMWTDDLFRQMARLSKQGATFGTFTAAGIVKRGLANVGFTIQKRNGFGRKRDMLTGTYSEEKAQGRDFEGPYYRYNRRKLSPGDEVIVVGSGLAAATATLALAKQGLKVTVCFDGENLASGASGNPQGGFYPQLHAQESIASRLQAHSFLFARAYYNQVIASQEGQRIAHDFCGVAQLNFNEKVAERQRKLIENDVWPSALVHAATPEFISERAKIPLPFDGLFIPLGGWISPPDLVTALLTLAQNYGQVTLKPHHRYGDHEVMQSSQGMKTVRVNFDTGETLTAKHLILALGAGAVNLPAFASLPLRPVRGQVEAIPSQSPLKPLATVLCHKGYMTPAHLGRHALGSTYGKDDLNTDVNTQDTEQNLQTHKKAMLGAQLVEQLHHDGTARAATRLGSPDHQPVCGVLTHFTNLKPHYVDLSLGKPISQASPIEDIPVSTLCCLGSRGLTTAPLAAELLASELTHSPLPLTKDLCHALHPARFMVRECIRGILED